jgi:hypothetical protein
VFRVRFRTTHRLHGQNSKLGVMSGLPTIRQLALRSFVAECILASDNVIEKISAMPIR